MTAPTGDISTINQSNLTPEMLRELLEYDDRTGKLVWRKREEKWFLNSRAPSHQCMKSWNTQYAGREALTSTVEDGYRRGAILGKAFYAHRVCFAIYHCRWPEKYIDHINGDRSDNRIKNIREASRLENARNCFLQKNNTSGNVGVYWDKKREKWQSLIRVEGKLISLGYHAMKEDAIQARKKAELEYGFSGRHGEPTGHTKNG